MKQEHRFFVEGVSFIERDISFVDEKLFHQLSRVLRLHSGDTVILLDNKGFEYEVRVISLEKKHMEFYILNKRHCTTEPSITIHLFQALLKKKDKFEWVLQKGTEVGISVFTPLKTTYGEFKGRLEMDRCYSVLKEAAEQSHRGKIPEITGERVFSDALQEVTGDMIVFDPLGEHFSRYFSHHTGKNNISMFIGPEGGFSDKELLSAQKQGAAIISAGSRILRSETAGIFLPGLILSLLEKDVQR